MVSAPPGLVGAGQLPAGIHVCWVLDDIGDYSVTAASFLAEAATAAQQPIVYAPADSALSAALKPLAVLIADPFTEFLAGGPLDVAAMARVLREQTARAVTSGHRGVRLLADMDWLRLARPKPGTIAAYEALLDRLAAELSATLVCAYRRSSFAADALTGALAVHSVLYGHAAQPQFQFVSRGTQEWLLSGEIDIKVTTLFAAAFHAAVRLGNCIVSLHGLDFIDLSGMRAIVTAAADAAGPIELRGAPPVFRRYWQVCDLAAAAPNVRLIP